MWHGHMFLALQAYLHEAFRLSSPSPLVLSPLSGFHTSYTSACMYWASSDETHLRRGLTEPFLYRTPSTIVKSAAMFLVFCASSLSLGTSLVLSYFIMSATHSGSPVLTTGPWCCRAGSSSLALRPLVQVCRPSGSPIWHLLDTVVAEEVTSFSY